MSAKKAMFTIKCRCGAQEMVYLVPKSRMTPEAIADIVNIHVNRPRSSLTAYQCSLAIIEHLTEGA